MSCGKCACCVDRHDIDMMKADEVRTLREEIAALRHRYARQIIDEFDGGRSSRFAEARDRVLVDHAGTFQALADRPTEPAPLERASDTGPNPLECLECGGGNTLFTRTTQDVCRRCGGSGLEPGL